MITIKLSDYLIEKSISDFDTSEIALEQAVAEVNVNSAICEAYMKLMYVTEADGETSDTGFWQKVKNFFISIGNWFRRIVIQLSGWISEKRVDKVIKRLESMTEDEKKNFQGVLPYDDIFKGYNGLIASLNLFSDMLHSNTKTSPEDLKKELQSIRKNSKLRGDEKLTDEKISNWSKYGYEEYLDAIKRFKEAITNKKDEFKKIREKLKNKTAADTFEQLRDVDDKTAKQIYRELKKTYNVIYAHVTSQMTWLVNIIKQSEKILKKSPDLINDIGEGIGYDRGELKSHVTRTRETSTGDDNSKDKSDEETKPNSKVTQELVETINENKVFYSSAIRNFMDLINAINTPDFYDRYNNLKDNLGLLLDKNSVDKAKLIDGARKAIDAIDDTFDRSYVRTSLLTYDDYVKKLKGLSELFKTNDVCHNINLAIVGLCYLKTNDESCFEMIRVPVYNDAKYRQAGDVCNKFIKCCEDNAIRDLKAWRDNPDYAKYGHKNPVSDDSDPASKGEPKPTSKPEENKSSEEKKKEDGDISADRKKKILEICDKSAKLLMSPRTLDKKYWIVYPDKYDAFKKAVTDFVNEYHRVRDTFHYTNKMHNLAQALSSFEDDKNMKFTLENGLLSPECKIVFIAHKLTEPFALYTEEEPSNSVYYYTPGDYKKINIRVDQCSDAEFEAWERDMNKNMSEDYDWRLEDADEYLKEHNAAQDKKTDGKSGTKSVDGNKDKDGKSGEWGERLAKIQDYVKDKEKTYDAWIKTFIAFLYDTFGKSTSVTDFENSYNAIKTDSGQYARTNFEKCMNILDKNLHLENRFHEIKQRNPKLGDYLRSTDLWEAILIIIASRVVIKTENPTIFKTGSVFDTDISVDDVEQCETVVRGFVSKYKTYTETKTETADTISERKRKWLSLCNDAVAKLTRSKIRSESYWVNRPDAYSGFIEHIDSLIKTYESIKNDFSSNMLEDEYYEIRGYFKTVGLKKDSPEYNIVCAVFYMIEPLFIYTENAPSAHYRVKDHRIRTTDMLKCDDSIFEKCVEYISEASNKADDYLRTASGQIR